MHTLIVGGTGFIGSYLCNYFSQQMQPCAQLTCCAFSLRYRPAFKRLDEGTINSIYACYFGISEAEAQNAVERYMAYVSVQIKSGKKLLCSYRVGSVVNLLLSLTLDSILDCGSKFLLSLTKKFHSSSF